MSARVIDLRIFHKFRFFQLDTSRTSKKKKKKLLTLTLYEEVEFYYLGFSFPPTLKDPSASPLEKTLLSLSRIMNVHNFSVFSKLEREQSFSILGIKPPAKMTFKKATVHPLIAI